MIKWAHDKEKAVRFTIRIEGNLQEYALAFLHIWNNARENKECFYKVENNASNCIMVTAKRSAKTEVQYYLSQFGEIEEIEEVALYSVGFTTGTDWDEVYSDEEKVFIIDTDCI